MIPTKESKKKEHRVNAYYLTLVSLILISFTAYEFYIEETVQSIIFSVCSVMMVLASVREWRESL